MLAVVTYKLPIISKNPDSTILANRSHQIYKLTFIEMSQIIIVIKVLTMNFRHSVNIGIFAIETTYVDRIYSTEHFPSHDENFILTYSHSFYISQKLFCGTLMNLWYSPHCFKNDIGILHSLNVISPRIRQFNRILHPSFSQDITPISSKTITSNQPTSLTDLRKISIIFINLFVIITMHAGSNIPHFYS